jgi:hypothetical protein
MRVRETETSGYDLATLAQEGISFQEFKLRQKKKYVMCGHLIAPRLSLVLNFRGTDAYFNY